MFCEFVNIENYIYQCLKCGNIIYSEDGDVPIFPCSHNDIKELSTLFSEDSMIESRYRICETCEFFKNNACTQCGCPILRVKSYINKLSSPEDKCPINKW